MLRLTMTDNFNYQDVFKTNIPQLEQNVSLHAKYLFSAAQNGEFPEVQHENGFRTITRTLNRDQTFLEFKEGEKSPQRVLALSALGHVIGIDRRPTSMQPEPFRKSFNGDKVYDSNPRSEAFNGSRTEEELQRFYDTFYETVATLGLQHRLLTVFGTQNESSSESFARAA